MKKFKQHFGFKPVLFSLLWLKATGQVMRQRALMFWFFYCNPATTHNEKF